MQNLHARPAAASDGEIFLRELVSNASDACDKLRFEALDNCRRRGTYSIWVGPVRRTKTITIRDNGIGMSAQEADRNLGTIAIRAP